LLERARRRPFGRQLAWWVSPRNRWRLFARIRRRAICGVAVRDLRFATATEAEFRAARRRVKDYLRSLTSDLRSALLWFLTTAH